LSTAAAAIFLQNGEVIVDNAELQDRLTLATLPKLLRA
jgi:hypothetical protein